MPLNIQVNGTGGVMFQGATGPASSSVLLQIGSTYTAIAKTVDGSVFQEWTDGGSNTLSTSPEYTFTMETNLVLQADFTANPYIRVAGRYIGLFDPGLYLGEETNTLENSGYIALTVNTKGNFSGYWQTGTVRHPLSGYLNASLQYTNTFNLPGEGTVTIGLSLPAGSISTANWNSTISLSQVVDVINYEGAGRYSLQLTSSSSTETGTALANFTERGPAVITGTLPGGPRFSASSTFTDSDNAQWPFYTPLYGGKGCLLGWVEVGPGDGGTDYGAFDAYGNLVWLQPNGTVNYISVSGTMQ